MDVGGHGLVFRNGTMAAVVSERGMEFVNRAILMFNQPLKVGQLATGTQLNVWAKRATDAYQAFYGVARGGGAGGDGQGAAEV